MPTVQTLMDHSTALVNLVTQEMESRVSVIAKKNNFNISFKNIFYERYSKSFSDHSAASYCSSFSIKEIVHHYTVFLPQGSTAEWKTWMTSLRTLAYIEHIWTTSRLTAMIINKVYSYGRAKRELNFTVRSLQAGLPGWLLLTAIVVKIVEKFLAFIFQWISVPFPWISFVHNRTLWKRIWPVIPQYWWD